MRLRAHRLGLWLLGALLCLGLWAAASTARAAGDVLVLYSNSRLTPASVEFDSSLRAGLAERADLRVSVFSEFLDHPAFGGPDYDRTMATYLREKYSAHPPRLVIVGGEEALDFALRHGQTAFANVPVFYLAASTTFVEQRRPLPDGFFGVMTKYDFTATVEQALRWQPRARRLLIITGTTPWAQDWERRLREEAHAFDGRLQVDFMAGATTDEVLERVGGLGDEWLIFTPGYFRDGAGRRSSARDSAQAIAAAAAVPVYGPYSTFIGTGVVGGVMPGFGAMGRLAATVCVRLFEGTPPASLQLPQTMPMQMHVDWRQAQRWGIREADLPPDTVVSFKAPTFWQQYRDIALAGIAVVLVQSALIGALLVERRRRRRTAAALSASEQGMKLAAQAARLTMWTLGAGAVSTARPVLPTRRSTDRAMQHVDDFGVLLVDIHPADHAAVEAAVARARSGDGALDVEFRRVGPDGAMRWVAARGRAEPGGAPRMLGVALDVTERKQAELQAEQDRTTLRHMTRVSLLGQLSASIAHQLNQPLASILSNAEAARMMLDRTPVDLAELRVICDDIVRADERATDVIRQLGALFRRSDATLVALDLNALVLDTLQLLRGDLLSRHVSVRTELAPGLAAVAGDRVQLQQLLLNLMLNAADAMQRLPECEREMVLSTALRNGAVELCVTDRGPGIAQADLAHVFEPFWSGKDNGMGMGLAICRSIAAAHRGELTARNGAHGGAVFCLQLPATVP